MPAETTAQSAAPFQNGVGRIVNVEFSARLNPSFDFERARLPGVKSASLCEQWAGIGSSTFYLCGQA